jgi:hypothetical protein
MPESLVAAGAKNISFIYPSNLGSASASLLHFFNEGIATSKAHIAHIVGVPIATTDFGPAVATALQGADGVAAYMPVVSQAILVKTLRASNPNIQIALGSFQLGSSAVKELGSPAGLHIVGFGAQPTADVPAAKQFMTDMAKYFPSAPGLDDQSLGAWESTQVFAKIARSMPDVTAAAITGAMKSLTNFGLGGYAPPLTTTAGSCNVCGGATRILNPNVAFLKAEPDGSLVFAASNQFYNAFTGQTYTYSPS